MKRISTILLVLILVLTLAMAAGCDADVTTGDDNTATLILEGETHYTASLDSLDGTTLTSLLDFLIDSVGMLVMYDLDDSSILTGVNNTIALADETIHIYTSNAYDQDKPIVNTTVDGYTLALSSKTADKITLDSGCIIYLTTTPPAIDDTTDTDDTTTQTTTLIIAEGDQLTTYTADIQELAESTGIALLNYLVTTQELHLVTEDSGWGAYLTEIGTLVADDNAGTWISIYTSIEDEKDTSAYSTTLVVDGVTVYSSGLGITSMSVTDGCTIYIELGSY